MNDSHAKNRPSLSSGRLKRGGYWSGFSVCLFIVLLSVFTWAMQRRLTQYESIGQSGGHHMTATKVCLTERPRISIPKFQTIDRTTMFFVAFAFSGALRETVGISTPHGRDPVSARLFRKRSRSYLAYFFFLPPPVPAAL